MAVVDNDVRSSGSVVNHVDSFHAFTVDFLPEHRGAHDAIAEHAEPKERQSDSFREEYFANVCRDAGKSVSDDSDDYILEERGLLHKRRALLSRSQSLTHELVRHLYYFSSISSDPQSPGMQVNTNPGKVGP